MTHRQKIILFLWLCVSFVHVSGECTTTSQDDSEAVQRFTVSTVEEFINAIGPDRKIYLEPGDYMLDELPEIDDDYVWLFRSLLIRNVKNLSIIGLPGNQPVRILTGYETADVMSITTSENIFFQHLVFAHTDDTKGLCDGGGVLSVRRSSDITVADSILYGSGVFGVRLWQVKGFTLLDSTIKECTAWIMEISSSEDITIENSVFSDNTGWDSLISLKDSRNAMYKSTYILNNTYFKRSDSIPLSLFSISNSDLLLQDSHISNNSTTFFLHTEKDGRFLGRNCELTENTFEQWGSSEEKLPEIEQRFVYRCPEGLHLRNSPTAEADPNILAWIPCGSQVSVLGTTASMKDPEDIWYHIQADEHTGWVHDGRFKNAPPVGIVATRQTRLNIRQGPGIQYQIIAHAEKGEQVVILGQIGEWYDIQLHSARTGYAHSEFINLASTSQLVVKPGYAQHVNGLFFSPTGDFFVRRGERGRGDDEIMLWDIRSGELFDRLPGGFERGIPILSNQDGQFIVNRYRQDDGLKFGLINVLTGEKGQTFHDSAGGNIRTAAFSPDGRLLVSSHTMYHDGYDYGYDYEQEKEPECIIQIWNVHTEKLLHTFIEYFDKVNSLAFSQNGSLLAGGSGNYSVKLWDTESGAERFTLTGHSWFVNAVAFSPDGTLLASASDDGTVKLWDVQTGREVRTLSRHIGGVTAVAFSPDGRTIAGTSWDGLVKLWDVQTGREQFTLNGHSDAATSLAFRPDGRYLMSGGWDGRINVWDVKDGRKTAILFFLNEPRSGAMPEWFITTPDGQVEFSTGALDFLIYNSGKDDVELEDYKAQYYIQGLFEHFFAIHSK